MTHYHMKMPIKVENALVRQICQNYSKVYSYNEACAIYDTIMISNAMILHKNHAQITKNVNKMQKNLKSSIFSLKIKFSSH